MRKLLMLTAMALAAMAVVGTAAASAVPKLVDVSDHTTGQPCSTITVYNPTFMMGGCVVEDFEGTFEIRGAGNALVGYYPTTFDLRVGPTGGGYAQNPVVNSAGQWPREACKNASGQTLPWDVLFIDMSGSGDFQVRVKTCVQLIGAAGGSSESDWLDVVHFGADGWTQFTDVTNLGAIQASNYSADTTVNLATHP